MLRCCSKCLERTFLPLRNVHGSAGLEKDSKVKGHVLDTKVISENLEVA